MSARQTRITRFLAGIVLLLVAVTGWYALRSTGRLDSAVASPAVPVASVAGGADLAAPAASVAAVAEAALTQPVVAQSATAPVVPRLLAYEPKGEVQGVALTSRPPAMRDGAEKGRVLEITGISKANLGALAAGQRISLPTPGGELAGVVNLVQTDENGWVRVGGSVEGTSGSFSLASNDKSAGGLVMLPAAALAYEVRGEANGRVIMVERRIGDVSCVVLGRSGDKQVNPVAGALEATATTTTGGTVAAAPPLLSSRPTAPAVIYLDFDGETVNDPDWNNGNTIVAPASTLTAAEITEVFNRVKEDYIAFNVDVTTSLSRYNAVPANRRTHCIITSNDAAAPGAGGVAYINAFSTAGSSFSATIPCWVFNDGVVGIAEAASHEVGHTLGLNHDGRTSPVEEYYAGAGTGATGWAPIMGVGYDRALTQWSKGEYKSANNKEDDLALISRAANGFGYFTDEAGNTQGAAAALGVISGVINQTGIIAGGGDVDFYSFTSAGGSVSVNAVPVTVSPNLDILLELRNSAGTVLVSTNTLTALSASLTTTVSAGTYYLKVAGTGKGDVLVDGYTSYGSIGAYTLTGTISGVTTVPAVSSPAVASGQVGTAFSYQITASNSPTSYGVTGALPTGVTISAGTGLISGTPIVAGSFPVTISATNAQGAGTLALTITVAEANITLADAIDLVSPAATSSGSALWVAQMAVKFDGVDAAKSGVISDNQSSSLNLSVTGPVTLSYRWKVDSEAGYDKLNFMVDGVVIDSISGVADWALRTFAVPTGAHQVEWRYVKDASVSTGADAGYVDTVSVTSSAGQRLVGDLSFGKITVGNTATRMFSIFNDSVLPIDVTGISYPSGFSGDWSAGQIAAGGSQAVMVTFAPTAAQVYSGTVTVSSNAALGATTLPISGEGNAAVVDVTVLTNNVAVTNISGVINSFRLYKIAVPSDSMQLQVTTTGGSGDVDLYVRNGSAPTTSVFTMKSDGSSTAESVTVSNPVAGDWYVLLSGYAAYSGTTLKATVAAPASTFSVSVASGGNGMVTGGGNFVAGTLVTVQATPVTGYSFVSWTEDGVVVSTSASYAFTISANRTLVANFGNLSTLSNNVPITGISGSVGSQRVYSIVVPTGVARLTFTTSGGSGDADIYVKRGVAPTATSYTYKSDGSTNSETVSVLRPASGTWYVLVRGYTAYSSLRLNATMTLLSLLNGVTPPDATEVISLMAGGYDGLVGGDIASPVVRGSVRVQLNALGGFTCKAVIDGLTRVVKGVFDEQGAWSGMIGSRAGLVPINLALDLVGQEGLTGTVSLVDSVQQISASRLAAGAAEQVGIYRFELPADVNQGGADYPQTPGDAVLTIQKRGETKFYAVLGDGTKVVRAGVLCRNGDIALYAPLYRSTGSIGGTLNAHSANSDQVVDGTLQWIKRERLTDLLFPAGFSGEVLVDAIREVPQ